MIRSSACQRQADPFTALSGRHGERRSTPWDTIGPDALADNPGDVYADSAYRSDHFGQAVRAKGGASRIVATGMWGRDEAAVLAASKSITSRSTASAGGLRKSSGRGNGALGYGECAGGVFQRPACKFV